VGFTIFRCGRVQAATVAIALAVTGFTSTAAAIATSTAAVRPALGCAELVGTYRVPGATTHVETATPIPATKGAPAYCDVKGRVEPAVSFELKIADRFLQRRLPAIRLCGTVRDHISRDAGVSQTCAPPADGNVAVAATDDGHVGLPVDNPFLAITDGTWAAPQSGCQERLLLSSSAQDIPGGQTNHFRVLRVAAAALVLRRLARPAAGKGCWKPSVTRTTSTASSPAHQESSCRH